MAYEKEKKLLPMFPQTAHLPIEPNTGRDDLVASEAELATLCATRDLIIEEKIDGANSAITVRDKQPIVRNRLHILNKAFSDAKTPAKKQFTAIWSWYYDNAKKFAELEKLLGFVPSVYGEWLKAQHTVSYDLLPSFWIPYDIYNASKGIFISPLLARYALLETGFSVPPLVHPGGVITQEQLIQFRDGKSELSSTEQREGIYVKLYDADTLIGRYKMVRPGFVQNEDWNKEQLICNKLKKK